jgi:endonuclease III
MFRRGVQALANASAAYFGTLALGPETSDRDRRTRVMTETRLPKKAIPRKKVPRKTSLKASSGKPGADIRVFIDRLEQAHPDARLALDFSSPLELLVALVLAAQCTDERVNLVTRSLFKKYGSARDYAEVSQEALEEEVRTTGFYRNKAKAIRACCRELVKRFGGEVPARVEDLVSLPGVGRKTANIVLGNAFGTPAVGVDTHVARLAYRMGFTKESDPDRIEEDLCRVVPRKNWVRFCHLLQFHGRRICRARKPECPICPVNEICPRNGL